MNSETQTEFKIIHREKLKLEMTASNLLFFCLRWWYNIFDQLIFATTQWFRQMELQNIFKQVDVSIIFSELIEHLFEVRKTIINHFLVELEL